MNDNRVLLRAASINQVAKLADTGYSLLLSVILTARFGHEGYGSFARLNAVVLTITAVTGLGAEDFVLRVWPGMRRKKAISIVVRLALGRTFLSIIAGSIALAAIDPRHRTVGLIWLVVYTLNSLITVLLYAQQLVGRYVSTHICTVALQSIICVAASKLPTVINSLIAATAIECLAMLFLLGRDRRRKTGETPSDSTIKQGSSRKKFLIGVAVSKIFDAILGRQVDVVLLSLFGFSLSELGDYALTAALVTSLLSLPTLGLAGVGLAHFARAESQGREDSAWRSAIVLTNALSLPLAMGAQVIAGSAFRILYPTAHFQTGVATAVIVCTLIGRVAGGGAHVTVLTKPSNIAALLLFRGFSAMLYFPIAWLAMASLGMVGLASASGATAALAVVLELCFVAKRFDLQFPTLIVAKLLAFSLPVLCVTSAGAYWSMGTSQLFSLTCAAAIVSTLSNLKLIWSSEK